MAFSLGPLDGLVELIWSITGWQILALVCLYFAFIVGAVLLSALLGVVAGPTHRPIKGAHVVITGGSEGIGLALGLEAAKQGAHVTVLSRKVEKLQKAVAQLESVATDKSAQRISYFVCDVTDAGTVQKAIGQAEALGPIDFLVCAAGAAYPGYFLEQDIELFERSMKLNYLGTVYTIKAASTSMVARGTGHIIAIASGAAAASFLGYSTYAPTKFAVRGFCDAIRNELIGTGVRVSIGYPPDTDTPGFEQENKTKPPECLRISPPEVYSAVSVAQCLWQGVSKGVYHLPSPDLVQNQLINMTAGITPPTGSTFVLAAISPLLTVVMRLFGCWADYVANGYGKALKKRE